MTMATLRLLFWKDVRQHRLVLVGTLLLLVMPFVLTAIQAMRSDEPFAGPEVVAEGAFMAMFLAVLSSAIVGGASFASERADGSADGLQLLLPRRGVLLVGRMLFAAAAITIGFGVPIMVGGAVVWLESSRRTEVMPLGDLSRMVLLPGSLSLAAFGVAWAWSSVRRSPAIGAAIGIGAAITIAFLVPAAAPRDVEVTARVLDRVVLVEVLVGAVAFVLGCGLYLHRTEP